MLHRTNAYQEERTSRSSSIPQQSSARDTQRLPKHLAPGPPGPPGPMWTDTEGTHGDRGPSRLTWTRVPLVCSYLHMRPPSDLLTETELDRLSDFLESIDTAMNLEEFDGFLCALISGPETVMLSEYWPIAMGCDPAEVEVFSTLEETQGIFDLVLKHWNSIATRLYAGEPYFPVLLEDDAGQATGIEWAQGFLEGVRLRHDGWTELFEDEDDGGAILPMLALAYEDHPDPSMRYDSPPPEKRDEVLALMTAGLVRI